MKTVTVREYARLTTDPVSTFSLDRASISAADFDELCTLNERRKQGLPSFLSQENRVTLRLRHYVGVLETKSGTCIEILPKTCEEDIHSAQLATRERKMLVRMLMAGLNVPVYEGLPAGIASFSAPLSEWLVRQFLLALHRLLKHGLHFDYERRAEEKPYLRGRLDIGRQIVQPPQRRHLFHVRYDAFSVNRPEHRLLRSALECCLARSQDTENRRLAGSLCSLFADIPPSAAIAADFRQWNAGRHMAHYQTVRPWCEFILGNQIPFALAGEWHGLSMLFPMERLFEAYVAACLRQQLRPEARLATQVGGSYLCRWEEAGFFALRPDIRIQQGNSICLLDTKWKKLAGSRQEHFGISQHDFYQMFAYGQKYLAGAGDMALIYPLHNSFPRITSPFLLSGTLRLWILGWDLERDCLCQPSEAPFSAMLERYA